MKNVFVFILIGFIAASCSSDKKTAVEKAVTAPSTILYGESFIKESIITTSELSTLMANLDSIPMIMSGTIEKTCIKKGCWMQLSSNEQPVRVTFKDYGFFVPKTGVEGKQAIVNGYCIRKKSTVAELQHFAQDAGKTESEIALITQPKTEYSFVASGVFIQ